VAFDVAAESYDRFMGRYSSLLAPTFAQFAGVATGQRILDVGCGPGALTAELVARAAHVSCADPSASFVDAARERFPTVDVQQAVAEELPFPDGAFDAALAQLVVHFMSDPVGGIREMARVTRTGGTVAACTWDIAGGRSPMSPLWAAVRNLGLELEGEGARPGSTAGELRTFFEAAGLDGVEDGELSVAVEHETFDEWWEPFTLGVGPAGQALARLEPEQLDAVRDEARSVLGEPPIRVPAAVWAARGRPVDG
jgi:SAM-dependent methyltransferase